MLDLFKNLESYDAAVAVIVPLIVGFLSKCSWPGYIKGLIAFAVCLLYGVGRTMITGADFSNAVGIAGFVAVVAQVSYSMLTKDFAQALQAVGPVKDENANRRGPVDF